MAIAFFKAREKLARERSDKRFRGRARVAGAEFSRTVERHWDEVLVAEAQASLPLPPPPQPELEIVAPEPEVT